jgi:hypothetical protein
MEAGLSVRTVPLVQEKIYYAPHTLFHLFTLEFWVKGCI